MLSIRTNLTSLLAQNSLRTSSNKLNQAIERMTTGFKINNAKDNAANYSISTNLSTKIGAYQVAEENTAMGLDMVTTASETLSLIEDKLSRARALCVQAQNGTYGQQSLDAIKSELGAIVDELVRTKENAQYNDINLFGKEGMPVANPETGFIADVVVQNPEITVSDPTQLLDAIENNSIIGISNAETLAQLATIVNNDLHNCEGKTIVLTEDIDLSGYSNWTPIGYYGKPFKGNFNGNGHTVLNLTITSSAHDGVGLFGSIVNGTFSNLSLMDVAINLNKSYVASLIGKADNTVINNCGVKGNISAVSSAGVVSYLSRTTISNTYFEGSVSGAMTGGIARCLDHSSVATNCYSRGSVTGTSSSFYAGGLFGEVVSNTSILNSYTTSAVSGAGLTGGIAATLYVGSGYGECKNVYWDVDQTGQSTSVVGEGLSTDEFNSILMLSEINQQGVNATLQVGISDDLYSSIGLDFGLATSEILAIKNSPTSAYSLATIDYMLSKVTAKQTELGAVENRLTSALEEIGIKYENLVSTRSTIRDADISEVSSQYIQQQILQQASSTLLATANQSPDLALRLIMNSTI